MASVVLVTGAKAGIGKGILEAYAARPNTTAIAAIRDRPNTPAAKILESVPMGPGSRIIVTTYDAASDTSAKAMVHDLQTNHAITHLDIVIANAGILKQHQPLRNVTQAEMLEHFNVNTVGPLLLYQATRDLLHEAPSANEPKFFIISSNIGSNTLMDNYPLPVTAYGTSKAAVNWIASKIHREEDRIVVVPLQPGWVKTEMGTRAASFVGMTEDDVPVTIEDSIKGVMALFDKADKKNWSGGFWNQNLERVPW